MRTRESDLAARWFRGFPVVSSLKTEILKGIEHISGNLCRGEDGKYESCTRGPALSGENLEYEDTKAGTLPGGVYRDKTTGLRYVVKFYPNPMQGAVEVAANSLYRAAGIEVPSSMLVQGVQHEGQRKMGLASRWIHGLTPSGEELAQQVARDLAEGFGMDAFLANWDVIGAAWDNLGYVGGIPYRVDNGGSMMFRALGELKDFPGDRVPELRTFLDPKVNSKTAALYKDLFEAHPELKLKSLERVARLTDAQIEHAVATAGFEKIPGVTKEQRDRLIETLKGRRDVIAREASRLRAELKAAKRVIPDVKTLRRISKAKFAMKEKARWEYLKIALESVGAMETSKLTFAQRKEVLNRVAERLLDSPDTLFSFKRVGPSRETETWTPKNLMRTIRETWTGSPNGKAGQWFRQVAAEYYMRDLKDEYLEWNQRYWVENIPDEMRDVVMSLRAASEALFIRHFGLKDRDGSITVYRGIYGAQANDIREQLASVGPSGEIEVATNVLQSYTSSESVAMTFATGGGVVIKKRIRAEQVWGFGGFGGIEENEIVVGSRSSRVKVNVDDVILVKCNASGVPWEVLKDDEAAVYAKLNIMLIELPEDPADDDEVDPPTLTHPGTPVIYLDRGESYYWMGTERFRRLFRAAK
jgi:hypothetical protein